MKLRPFLLGVLGGTVVLAAASGVGVFFYFKYFRGAGTAFLKPSTDITTALNTTNMPLSLPKNAAISIFAQGLGAPRVLVDDPAGTLIVSIPSQGKVVALPDKNNDGKADDLVTVAENLNKPHGLAFRCTDRCRLYIAETDQVAAYDYDEATQKASGKRMLLDLPGGGGHSTRSLLFLPPPNDATLLVAVGSTCNVCKEDDARRAAITALDVESGKHRLYASGLRNAVFLALHPVTRAVWVTEMGRDNLGDDIPPDEINIVKEGKDYGWPFCYGKRVIDPFGGTAERCASTEPSHIDIQAHSAPLGLAFFSEGWPAEYRGNLLVAYHGSWNRSVPTGYKIVRYVLNADGTVKESTDFISGWLQGREALGRPVGILIRPYKTMFISDDKAGVIYRLTGF